MKDSKLIGSAVDRRINVGRIPTLNVADLGHTEENEYVIKNWFYMDSLAMIYGASNSGKSFLAVDIAMHVAYGKNNWNHQRTNWGGVLYVAAEGAKSVEKRCKAFIDQQSTACWDMHIAGGVDFASNDDDVQRLINTCIINEKNYRQRTSLIIIDTLAMTIGGSDENSAQEMGSAIKRIKMLQEETGACVIMIHHSGKDKGRGARGSSALRAAVDTEVEVRSSDVDGTTLHAARVTKQRDAERAEDFNFKLKQVSLGNDSDGDPMTTCVVVKTDIICPEHDIDSYDAKPKVVTRPQLQGIALKALDAEKLRRGTDEISFIDWRESFMHLSKDLLGDAPNRFKWRTVHENLIKQKDVTFDKDKNTVR